MHKPFALIPALLLTLPSMAGASLRVAPDRLDRAAISLGRQAKVSIGISEPGLALVRARSVADAANVDAALQQMLPTPIFASTTCAPSKCSKGRRGRCTASERWAA